MDRDLSDPQHGPRGEMRRSLALTCVLAATAVGCGGHATPRAHVLGLKVTRGTVGCTGWFEVTGQTLAAHLAFTGRVRNVVIRTMSDNGEAPTDDLAAHVPSGSTQRTIYVRGVTRIVVATQATVDDGGTAHSTCALSLPH